MNIPTVEKTTENNELILPCMFDICFKEIFGNEDYPEITAYLMATLFKIPYKETVGKIKFISNHKKNTRVKKKNGDKDVTFILSLDTEYIINLESNLRSGKSQTILDRNLMHIANMFGQGVERGEKYDRINIVYQYNFNSFQVDKEHQNDEILDVYSIRNDNGNEFSNKFKIFVLNLDNLYNI